ncbi:unnamed protein product, partial [Discosporangium mesarthrocarpum]
GGNHPFNVHFGAGRLGLGLVAGAIVGGGQPFAFVQRPKTTWKAITSKGCGAEVDITVNGSPVVEDVVVISEECDIMDFVGRGVDKIMAVVGDRPTLLQFIHLVSARKCRRRPLRVQRYSPTPFFCGAPHPHTRACVLHTPSRQRFASLFAPSFLPVLVFHFTVILLTCSLVGRSTQISLTLYSCWPSIHSCIHQSIYSPC